METEQQVSYVQLTGNDWPDVHALWTGSGGVVLRDDDNPDSFQRLLRHNPGLCLGARAGSRLVGAVLAGYDGKRGYLYHMAIDPAWRRRGIGSGLAHHTLVALRGAGAGRVHLLVSPGNAVATAFWRRLGFQVRHDVELMTLTVN